MVSIRTSLLYMQAIFCCCNSNYLGMVVILDSYILINFHCQTCNIRMSEWQTRYITIFFLTIHHHPSNFKREQSFIVHSFYVQFYSIYQEPSKNVNSITSSTHFQTPPPILQSVQTNSFKFRKKLHAAHLLCYNKNPIFDI